MLGASLTEVPLRPDATIDVAAVIAALGLPSSVYRVRSAMVSEFSIDGGFDLFGERHPVAPN